MVVLKIDMTMISKTDENNLRQTDLSRAAERKETKIPEMYPLDDCRNNEIGKSRE